MRAVPLTKGYVAIVDDEDYELVSTFKWYALTPKATDRIYAVSRRGFVYMHRLILGLHPGDPYVDHINRDGLDNRRANVRLATNSQNQANNRPQSRPTASRFKGVTWHGRDKLWHACIKVDQRKHHLGYSKSEEDMARAYDRAAVQYFGEYARLNFPKPQPIDWAKDYGQHGEPCSMPGHVPGCSGRAGGEHELLPEWIAIHGEGYDVEIEMAD